MPRWSPSPVTVTCSSVSTMSSRAACAAITVEQQAASDARKNQPGFGAEPLPPIEAGMSVSTCSPFGPVTRHLSPFRNVAVAGAYLARAFSGLAVSALLRLSNAVATSEAAIAIPAVGRVSGPGKTAGRSILHQPRPLSLQPGLSARHLRAAPDSIRGGF